MSKVNLIYYDDNISFNSENYGYVKRFKNKIKGAFFAINNVTSLNRLIQKLKLMNLNNKFTLITSGRAAEKVIPICSDLIDNVIIFCYYIDKYLPLKNKYSKIKSVVNDFHSIFNNLNNSNINNNQLIGNKIITIDDYNNTYIKLHKKLADFFDFNYFPMKYENSYKNEFNNFIDSSDIDEASNIISWVNKVTQGTVKEFIEAYTGETPLCYSLNRWLRNCDENEYEKIKYFAGPLRFIV